MTSFSNDKNLLRQIILSHYDNPNNKVDENFDSSEYRVFHNKSASCIDDITVIIKIDNDKIIDAKFKGIGCAISTSSTDILCDLIKNKTIDESTLIFDNYLQMIKNEKFNEDILGELVAFNEIYKQPNRIKCSLIGLDACSNLLKGKTNE